ncbi:hypothetical protein QTP86_008477 [Hemibagrus guttatus]|nr:hypothetical protein QTP86_008477 [Hemibagrus guttatus]
MDLEIDRRIGAAAAVMRSMYRSVVVKKELSRKAKLSIYQSIYVPTLTYGHELWVMTERVRSRMRAAEMSFLRRVAGHSLRDRVRSSVTQEELGVEPLLLHFERGQLRWLGHLFRMPPGCLPGEVFRACPTGKRPRGRPRTPWRDYVSRLAWECLGVPPEELEEVSGEREGAGGNWATVGRRSRGGRRVRRQRKGKGRELADMMERRKVDILCVQETRWKGSKARSIGAGFKLFYYGVDSKRNGVGVVLKEEFVRNVLEVGCELEEKERFWSELDEVMESIPTGDEEVMGKFGVKERNLEGQIVVDFAKRMDMAVVNTYFQKREEHRVTYKSGGRSTQKKRQKLRQALGGQVLLPDDWETTAEVIRETGRKDSVQRKRLAKKKWDMDRTEENRQEYKELQRRVKREVSKAKQKAYEELYTRLDTREGEKDLYRVLTSEESVQRRWKEYFEELMNEENEREKRVEGVNSVEQKVDKIRKDEVRKALKRMKSGKAVGPDDIPVEVWKCLGEAAVEFLASLFNRVLENLEKAYDRVPREELWYCMRKSGVAEKYVRVVQDMYERSRTVVRCAVGQTEEFNVEVGLHQGSALSPFLFAIVMDQLSEEVRQESPWTMMFADDIVICSESREQVEENLERWRFALERRGMKVSRSKTEYMCVNEREGSGTVRLQGEEVKKVQEFKYLGSTVQSNGECGKEVKKRVQAGWNGWRKVSGVLCDRKISARIKGKVYRTVVRPAMLYGLETVSLRKRQESELEVAELKMLSKQNPGKLNLKIRKDRKKKKKEGRKEGRKEGTKERRRDCHEEEEHAAPNQRPANRAMLGTLDLRPYRKGSRKWQCKSSRRGDNDEDNRKTLAMIRQQMYGPCGLCGNRMQITSIVTTRTRGDREREPSPVF